MFWARGITPGEYYDMGIGEKLLLRAIVERHLEMEQREANQPRPRMVKSVRKPVRRRR